MLSFFPTPYPDELLYSVLARYHIRSGNTGPKLTLWDLFGSNDGISAVDLPYNLAALAKNLSLISQMSCEELLQNHTLYPFYAAFLPQGRAREVAEAMKSDYGGGIHGKVGIRPSAIKSLRFFRFCPSCRENDQRTYGELYWHRIHQVPGVLVCPHHGDELQDSLVPMRGLNRQEYRAATTENCIIQEQQTAFRPATLEAFQKLSQDVSILLTRKFSAPSLAWFRQQYRSLLIERGLASATGRVKQRDLVNQFLYFYGWEVLEALDSAIDPESDCNWLNGIVRKHRKAFHPIRHLLMLGFLGISVEDVFERGSSYQPFGAGPWLCLNAAAEHYLKPVITRLEISLCCDSKKPVGTFSCTCGFSYCRTGPDTNPEDGYRIGKIKAVGPVWEQKLKTLVEQEQLGLRATARQLKVDPRTINRYVDLLQLKPTWRTHGDNPPLSSIPISPSPLETFDDLQRQHRDIWESLQLRHIGASKTQLRQIAPKTYAWLYRNDRNWLHHNSPSLQKPVATDNRVNWQQRDQQVRSQAQAAVEELLARPKPVRITVSKIGKMIGHSSLIEQCLGQMPLTKAYLDSVVETVEDFQVRRVRWAAKQLDERGTAVEAWKIVRLAGLGATYSEVVCKAIEQEVKIRLRMQNSTLVRFVP
jgi:hypothetical protein